MPTVILLDASLSMCQHVRIPDSTEPHELRNLAVHGLTTLLEYMTVNCKLEFTTLSVYFHNILAYSKPPLIISFHVRIVDLNKVTEVHQVSNIKKIAFSSQYEVIVPFTRDFDTIKSALISLDVYDKTSVLKALEGARNIVMEEWGAGVPTQVVIITDGEIEIGRNSLKNSLESYEKMKDKEDSSFPLPFPFPSKLHVVCVNNSTPSLQATMPLYQKLIEINKGGGQVFVSDESLSFKSIQQLFLKFADIYYKPFHGVLSCGNLSSSVTLSPPPEQYVLPRDFEWVKAEMSSDITICGFIDIADVASPPSLSRHLVLPIQINKDEMKTPVVKMENVEGIEEELTSEDGKQPSFCVLLHGSLKVEGMVAICNLGGDWYGMLYSWADSKKKSNLMLSAFEPGADVVPWLGSISSMGPVPSDVDVPNFPIKPSEKRSYAQNCVVWIKQSGLQADIQKILRHARKLPEKTQHFYKELNRLRRAALSFGFYELLEGMAYILDRECTLLPGSAHPDASLQLTHSASEGLRGPSSQDYNTQVMPLITKFTSND